jgi:hypothetical protein
MLPHLNFSSTNCNVFFGILDLAGNANDIQLEVVVVVITQLEE